MNTGPFFTERQYHDAVQYIQQRLPVGTLPSIGMVCGTGMSQLAHGLQGVIVSMTYEEIPGFVETTAHDHEGKLVFGFVGRRCVVCMMGRCHAYEGYSMSQVTFPIRVMAMLGIKLLVLTSAAGGLNPEYQVGDIMVLEDHLALPLLCGNHPLVGPNVASLGPRFVSTSDAYSAPIRKHVFRTARRLGLLHKVHSGVHCFVTGPSYESRCECRMLRRLGGDTVGMSTVPEVLVAHHAGVAVLAMSLITNCVVTQSTEDVRSQVLQEPLEDEVAGFGIDPSSTPPPKNGALLTTNGHGRHADEEGHANHEEVMRASTEFAQDVFQLVKTSLETLHHLPGF